MIRLDRRWDDLFSFGAIDDSLAIDPTAPPDDAADDAKTGNAPALLRFRRVVDRFRSRLGERRTDA